MSADGRGRLVIISGPSGVGKGTVIAAVMARRPEFWLSVSTTTRLPRPGEADGVNYFFVSDDEFRERVAHDGFLEWATYAGNSYGTAREPVERHLAQGRSVILEIDLAGARQVERTYPEALRVFLAPPDVDELRARLEGRGTESLQVARARLDRAVAELAAQDEFDHVVVNSEVSRAADELLQLIDTDPG